MGINAHHLKEDFFDFIESMPFSSNRISLVAENTLLGTAGGIANVASGLSLDDTFIVHNGDIFCDVDLEVALGKHRKSGTLVTLLVKDGSAEIEVTSQKIVNIAGKRAIVGDNAYKFTGISIWEPQALEYLPKLGKKGELVPALIELIEDNPQAMEIFHIGNSFWSDMGTPEEYLHLHERLLEDKGIFKISHLPKSTKMSGFACICDDVKLGECCILQNTIIWPGCRIEDGRDLTNSIATPNGIFPV